MFHTLFYEPIYNLLVLSLTIIPLHDVGLAIILVTCIVKGILLPLNLSATRSQFALKKVEGEINTLREKEKNNPQEMSKKMIEIYRREKINPLATLFVMIFQFPVLIALYFVFSKGLHPDPNSLYSFLSFPTTLHTHAFGILDVTSKNIFIGVLTGISAYFFAHQQTNITPPKKKQPHEETFQDHFMKSMRMQMLYVLPIIMAFSASVLPAALGLYWTVSNILNIIQGLYIKKKYHFS